MTAEDASITTEEEVPLSASESSPKDKHSYRVIMYDKLEVEQVERTAIAEMIAASKVTGDSYDDLHAAGYTDTVVSRAAFYFPEGFSDAYLKRRRKAKKSSIYFIEDVAKFLWLSWNKIENKTSDQAYSARNRFLTYCYPLIDGVIFKYQRHKYLPYDEIFQNAVIKIIDAMPKFDPKRQVGTDDSGNPIYARVYTFFVLVTNYGMATITMAHGAYKLQNLSYDVLSRVLGDPEGFTDASIIYQEFLLFLRSIIEKRPVVSTTDDDGNVIDSDFNDTDYSILKTLYALISDPESQAKLTNNLEYTLRTETKLKQSEISSCLSKLRGYFGPLSITSEKGTIDFSTAVDN